MSCLSPNMIKQPFSLDEKEIEEAFHRHQKDLIKEWIIKGQLDPTKAVEYANKYFDFEILQFVKLYQTAQQCIKQYFIYTKSSKQSAPSFKKSSSDPVS